MIEMRKLIILPGFYSYNERGEKGGGNNNTYGYFFGKYLNFRVKISEIRDTGGNMWIFSWGGVSIPS